jgi:poly-gamma-glutamate capsule biosynthesis protein CapA/YwtB (metallophosphatase superfamily)
MGVSSTHLSVLGQALIQHDLRAAPWPDLAGLAALLGQADACFTDLETAIRTPLAEAPTRDDVFLHAADPAVLDCLADLSISLLATANNHVWDLGKGGIVGMLRELDLRSFAQAGCGVDMTAAAAPAYRRTANGTLGLVAAASGAIRDGAAATTTRPGVNELRGRGDGGLDAGDVARFLAGIGEAAGHAEIVIAYHHNHIFEDKPPPIPSPVGGGGSGRGRAGWCPPQWQQHFARRCIDAGASLYVSHGAPRLHGIEIYRGRPIFYDLGNFIFQTATAQHYYGDEVWQSVLATCRFSSRRFVEMVLTPVQLNARGLDGAGDLITRGRPSIARGRAAAEILDHLDRLSRPLGTMLERAGDSAIIRAR